MRRLTVVLTILIAVGVVAACGDSGLPAADAVIAPEALARALADDRATALATYGGQVLELSGTVGEKIQPGGLNPTIGVAFTSVDEQLAFDANLSFVSFDSDDAAAVSDFGSLAVGDAVTLRCRLEIVNPSAELFLVNDCRVVP